MPPRHDHLARAFARALAPTMMDAARVDALGRALAERVASDDDPEASVRVSVGKQTAGRMMLERSDAATAQLLARGLALPWRAECDKLVESCRALGLPLIVGWDVGTGGALYKLYANASDVSRDAQRELVSRLALRVREAPQVLGLNVHAGHVEVKAYYQRARLAELREGALTEVIWDAARLPAPLAQFLDAPAWVLSCDLYAEQVRARAVFAAVGHGRAHEAEALLLTLSGAPWSTLQQALPFAPGPIRQLGWGLDGTVTVYAKPANTAAPVHTLAPLAVFATEHGEVGVYVQPSATTPRAFLRTATHAISFRTRSGAPVAAELDVLARWIAIGLASQRGKGADLASQHGEGLVLGPPPAPWRVVRC